MPGGSVHEYRAPVRYLEADQQGVVFNMWYLAYLDEAMTEFLAAQDLSYATLQAGGHDVQVVHTELDWTGGLRWGETVRVQVRPESVGRTSFTLAFDVSGDAGTVLVRAKTVYVCIRIDGSGKTPIPDALRTVLTR